MKAESKVPASPVPVTGTQLRHLRIIAGLEITIGVGMLALVLAWLNLPEELTAFDDLFALFMPSMGGLRTVFQSQVLLLMGILMVIGGIGLLLPRGWAWTIAHAVGLTVLLLSAQIYYILLTQGGHQGAINFNDGLMIFQGFQVGVMVFLMQKEVRAALRIHLIDFIVAALFACILALDWNFTIYAMRTGGM
jgi:hypothetical protein